MSTDDTEGTESAVAPVEDGADSADATDDDRPALDESGKATVDLEGVDEIADEIDEMEASDGDDGSDGEDTEQGADADADTDAEVPDLDLSWGDLYVDTLAMLLVAVVEEVGDEADDPITEDEIVELAQSGMIDLSAAVDKLVADMGGPTSMEPEYAVLAGTALLAVSVLVSETDVAKDALAGSGGALGGVA